MKLLNVIFVVVILAAGLGAAYFFLSQEPTVAADPHGHGDEHAEAGGEHGEDAHADDETRGPHGGRMLHEDGFELEVTIFETGVPPEFRFFPYVSEKPIAPGDVQLTVLLHRLGGRTDTIAFSPQDGFLKGDRVVEEPHSFDVEVNARYAGKAYSWKYASYEGRVEISEAAAREGGIETQPAGPGTISRDIRLPGEIALNSNRIVHVVPRLSGVVREVTKELGGRVSKGDLLAIVDSRELADAKSEYLASIERRQLAEARYTREKGLFEKRIASEEEFLTAKQALAEFDVSVRTAEQKLLALGLTRGQVNDVRSGKDSTLTDYPIHSPIDGTVIEKHMTVGEAVSDDADAFVVADMSSVWAEVVVYAADLKDIREGQNVVVRSEDLGIEAQGTISYIGALVGQQTRTAKAIVDIPNPEGLWRPGLFVSVKLAGEAAPAAVAAPKDAIQTFRDWSVVFLKSGDTYEVCPVELGASDETLVEITGGLRPGDVYVSKNSYLVKADIEKSGAAHDH